MRQGLQWGLAIVVAAVAIILLFTWLMRSPQLPPNAADIPAVGSAPPAPPAEAPPPPLGPPADAPAPLAPETPAGLPADVGGLDSDGEDMFDPTAEAWAQVDLEAAREAMPDNLYWKMSMPTQDEAVEAERAAERDRWNAEYGKILSGTGTDEEIRAYYDHRARLSGDYVEFTTYLLDQYRETLPERDVALLELARRLHLARLEEIPRQVEEARERKRKQDEARAAWLADEAEFGSQ